MAWNFGDGFDLYAAPADMLNGYWDSGSGPGSFGSGRFAGSRAAVPSGLYGLVKSSGQNDAVHHFVASVLPNFTLGGTTVVHYFELFDGVTAQCTVGFRQDGAIVLTAGGPGGTVLATYASAFANGIWYGFEIEVVINNTTGSFTVRKNGNSVNDFNATSLNTRASANNYANKIQFGNNSGNGFNVDDFFWQSGSSTGNWLGDIRCYTRMPNSDQSLQFTPSASAYPLTPFANATLLALSANVARYTPFTPTFSGTVGSVTIPVAVVSTANLKCAIYSSSGGLPVTVLGSATPISAPGVGIATFTFGTPVSVTTGIQYFVAFDVDASSGQVGASSASTFPFWGGATYASFPTNSPSVTATGSPAIAATVNVTPATTANFAFVSEAQQDGLTSYVYDSTAGHQDFYGTGAIGSTPATVIATTVRGYMQKSDVGTRTAAVQLKSGGAAIPSLWSAADAAANGATLTNGGQTLNVASATPVTTVRSSTSKSSGKLYIEIAYVGTNASGVQLQIGLASAGFVPSNNIGTSNYSGGMFDNGSITNSSAFFPNSGASFTWTANCVFGLSVDFTSGFFWIAKNNVQVNGGNPAAGTTWVMSFTPATVGALFLALSNYGATSPIGTFTINSTAASQTYAPPTGFTAWDSVVSTTVASPTLTLTTSGWQWTWRTDVVDPNTSAAWTAAAVNSVQIGPKVIA